MELEYDLKFEEMKKYIPFLENMIKRLSISGLASNPRQAQLDKIKSLRDLLSDKKKRMKMENLLKCEQVLINLYAKVEQRDTHLIKEPNKSFENNKTDLTAVRSKLKSVVSKFVAYDRPETLPEIAIASKTEEVCDPGTKELALFQRRPNKQSTSVTTLVESTSNNETPSQALNRNYTRVLNSPEPNTSHWSPSENKLDKPLFSRRSPRKSPQRYTPLHNKKERKKIRQKNKYLDSNDLNITLNVPEESLSSLNTDDIFSRIINCSDGDVDIDTLRVLRTQILGELGQTGSKDDISDLILKSYKKKSKKKKKGNEMEEGELSDSESEIIKSVYGSLVVMDKDNNTLNLVSKSSDNEATPRKIQICLVVNSQQAKSNISTDESHEDIHSKVDLTDFDNFNAKSKLETKHVSGEEKYPNSNNDSEQNKKKVGIAETVSLEKKLSNVEKRETEIKNRNKLPLLSSNTIDFTTDMLNISQTPKTKVIEELKKTNNSDPIRQCNTEKDTLSLSTFDDLGQESRFVTSGSNNENKIEIPLLNFEETVKKDVVSEIDILQALKNEIMSETSTALSTDAETPPLHQPKISKVVNTQEISNKKRISLEKYKAKSSYPPTKFISNSEFTKDDLCRKQSLKLTEKECERFNFLSKIALNDSSEDDEKSSLSLDDVYGDLAPKSPDHEDFADTDLKPPIIIPNDPVKVEVPSADSDIDMRKFMPVPNSTNSNPVLIKPSLSPLNHPCLSDVSLGQSQSFKEKKITLTDPRIKRELNICLETTDPLLCYDNTQRQIVNCGSSTPQHNSTINLASDMSFYQPNPPQGLANITPILTSNITPVLGAPMTLTMPSMTSNIAQNMTCNILPNMTAIRTPNARSYEMTPSRIPVENEDFSNSQHVYAPMFPLFDLSENEKLLEKQRHGWIKTETCNSSWEEVGRNTERRVTRWDDDYKKDSGFDSYQRSRRNDRYNYECPETFNRRERSQSSHYFDGSSTPLPSFGRDDIPVTPIHYFGRSDYMEKSTSNTSYGNCSDSRRSRVCDYNNSEDIRERRYYNDRNFNSKLYRSNENNRSYYNSDGPKGYYREQSISRDDRNANFECKRRNNIEYREPSLGRVKDREYEKNQFYFRRGTDKWENDKRNPSTYKKYDEEFCRGLRDSRYLSEKSKQPLEGTFTAISVPSVCVPSVGNLEINNLTVHSKGGCSFTIDTSIDKTFQMSHGKNNFDARRRRAASVGRTFDCDKSDNSNKSFRKLATDRNHDRNINKGRYRRASSVGRQIVSHEQNFNDIKAELRSFHLKSDIKQIKVDCSERRLSIDDHKSAEFIKSRDKRSQCSENETKTNVTKLYSPKKNIRDPRIRNRTEIKGRLKEHMHNRPNESKKIGIVYSNDNISKGAILGKGYGVKNYKIPKLKRPSTDTDTIPAENIKEHKTITTQDKFGSETAMKMKDNSLPVNKGKVIEKNIKEEKVFGSITNKKVNINPKNFTSDDILDNNREEKNIANDEFNLEKRVTRSAKKNLIQNLQQSSVRKTRHIKKLYFHESDSDENGQTVKELKQIKNTTKNDLIKKNIIKEQKYTSDDDNAVNKMLITTTINNIKESDSIDESKEADYGDKIKIAVSEIRTQDLKSYTEKGNIEKNALGDFPVDDLDIFHENAVSNTVIDNINALIADLDQDLDLCKGNNNDTNILKPEVSSDIDKVDETVEDGKIKSSNEIEQKNKHTERSNSVDNMTIDNPVPNNSNKSDAETSIMAENYFIPKNVKIAYIKQNDNVNKNTNLSNEAQGTKKEILINQQDNFITKELINNDAVVSTSGRCEIEDNENRILKSQNNLTISPNDPDSTFNIKSDSIGIISAESIPDSTEEPTLDINPDVTSTESSFNVIQGKHETSSGSEVPEEIDALEKLMSILQNKSKMKELISKLGSQNIENEKIKKKLEKLSEIVSDDEDCTVNDNTSDSKRSLETDKTLPKQGASDLRDDVNNDEQNHLSNMEEKHILHEKKNILENNCEQNTRKIANDSPNKLNDFDYEKDKTNVIDEVKDINNIETSNERNDIKNVSYEDKDMSISELVSHNKTLKFETENIREHQNSSSEDLIQEDQMGKLNVTLNKASPKKGRTKKGNTKYSNKNSKTLERKGLNNLTTINKNKNKPKAKGLARELQNLQNDIKEMFMKDDVLRATGIRMCRIAKLANEKDDNCVNEDEPVIVLQKCKNDNLENERCKKNTPKQKVSPTFNKPGPKSKTKYKDDEDPYVFETDSVNERNTSESKNESGTDSENESLASKTNSLELATDTKKKTKRKRGPRGWQAGIIKSKNKKKSQQKAISVNDKSLVLSDFAVNPNCVDFPDLSCFTDKSYCFQATISSYSCRLCVYSGSDIVSHYIKHHPHSEIPLSRLSPDTAKEAIEQCEELNFQAICKIPATKYTCRFCFKEIGVKKKLGLEDFFWHVVSTHTGEYKQLCSECVDHSKCPFHLDIPPPPGATGQLLGYICGKCNFTQLSLENLKTHVINRHNDEQTEVFTINLSVLTKKEINNFLKHFEDQSDNKGVKKTRKLRNRPDQNVTESSDQELSNVEKHISEPVSTIQSKLTFENDNISEEQYGKAIKMESVEDEGPSNTVSNNSIECQLNTNTLENASEQIAELTHPTTSSSDIFGYPHFKVNYITNGAKEYVCCINGVDNHYKSPLLISMKKHVQTKHSEIWDGYCFICKVIVTPQGSYRFKDCLQHFLDKHIDDLPVMHESVPISEIEVDKNFETPEKAGFADENPAKTYINVRPLSQLISTTNETQESEESNSVFPIIESVVSLGATDQPLPSPSYPMFENNANDKEYRYEEAQADIMSKKHRVVLDAMMSHVNLAQIFKCAGKFCSFTTDNAEESLTHASTHVRIGGEDALNCVYCDYDVSGNAIDLVTHVFKNHGNCPYVCGMCFYRAATSQLVHAHMNRLHPNSNAPVLRTAIVTGTLNEDGCLSRKDAVPFYLCTGGTGTDNPCKFRTYTPGKYCEHMQQYHGNATHYSCFICSESATTPPELIRHLKKHGLKLYQCTWCIHGADSESELLEHASAKHPCKQPKAYLRIITNEEGTTVYKVLPLAHLNKPDVVVRDISTSGCKKNPVREAERAIELEKLIGVTTSMIESISTPSHSTSVTEKNNTSEEISTEHPTPTAEIPKVPMSNLEVVETPLSNLEDTEFSLSSVEVHNPSSLLANLMAERGLLSPLTQIDDRATVKPVTKIEQNTPDKVSEETSQIVYCLDSDEDNVSTDNVVDLSDDTPNTSKAIEPEDQNKKLPHFLIYKCSKCKSCMKTAAGLLSHVKACNNHEDPILCAHCPLKITRARLISHYHICHLKTHVDKNMCLMCPVCPLRFQTFEAAEKHFKIAHSLTHSNITWKQQSLSDGGESKSESVPISIVNNQEIRGKRKRSLGGSRDKTVEPSKKMKKYGPLDIFKLPINPILDDFVYCALCEFSTKVKINMVRHLQLHAEQQPVPETAPINPVPHLETNQKHFDKMLNLASSSIISRLPDKNSKTDSTPAPALHIPPGTASRYPKFVPERQRLTCGAKDCAYISVDENMLKCHWETLHSGTNNYHCVHCPPYQYLDTSRPLTASRIIAHLKMHDVQLYACSLCSYYHYKRQILEKHLFEVHKGGKIMIVREENSTAIASTSSQTMSAPTMDLKPWQCGLCQFKSLLRPEVVDHCAKFHNSKMQYKCSYCAFRTSNLENIPKHQSKSHAGKPEEIFYYYYREGSVPNEVNGTPCWEKQRQKIEASGSHVKSEVVDDSALSTPPVLTPITSEKEVDLNLVKKEIIEDADEVTNETRSELGEFCDPNGLKYKCPLCKNVTEQSADTMQSHLYEELKYRKWGCGVCSYKAFHKAGLRDHMQTEHPQQLHREPIELPVDTQIEAWIVKLIEHQTCIITKNKENLAKQKAEIQRVNPSFSDTPRLTDTVKKAPLPNLSQKLGTKDLEKMFGPYGEPSASLYCCPKCKATFQDENNIRSHLEGELNKIRWFCSFCSLTFQTYHEAQFHCRSAHIGQSTRPVEAPRDANLRTNWIDAVTESQKRAISIIQKNVPQDSSFISEQDENSLLVVRFEKEVTTPEEQMAKMPSGPKDRDGDENKSVLIDGNVKNVKNSCLYCSYVTSIPTMMNSHVLKHYQLKVCCCTYCGLDGNRKQVIKHQRMCHPSEVISVGDTKIPNESPEDYLKSKNNVNSVCLVCRKLFTPGEAAVHQHYNFKPNFGRNGDCVVKCCVCSMLHKDVNACLNHHKACHPQESSDYVFCKLIAETDSASSACEEKLTNFSENKSLLKVSQSQYSVFEPSTSRFNNDIANEIDERGVKRKSAHVAGPCKRIARKSTSKPGMCFAKKSTTKLPLNTAVEYSFYNKNKSNEDLDKPILIPFCDTIMPFTMKKLPEIFGNPIVRVKNLSSDSVKLK